MKPTSRHKQYLIITTCLMLLTACHEGRQQLMPMQQTMDSVKMWYGQMQGDSMKVKGEQLYRSCHCGNEWVKWCG